MNLVVFGLGYSSQAFVRLVRPRFGAIVGTVRSAGTAAARAREGVAVRLFPGDEAALEADIAAADAMLVSVPPDETGDPVLLRFRDAIAAAPRLRWIGYLSTIGVYGDHHGAWIDETTEPRPTSRRSRWRLAADEAWLRLGQENGTEQSGKAVQVFRLAGIYGPGRSAFDKLAAGTAQRLVKPGQVFNRIHVDDIAAVLAASLDRPRAGAVYTVTDDEPAPPQDVVAHAAALAGVEPPPERPFDAAALSPMAASFWSENKRVGNRLLRDELGVTLAYPTYREGLSALKPDSQTLAETVQHHVPHAEVLAKGEPRSTRDGRASFEAPLRGAPQDEEGGVLEGSIAAVSEECDDPFATFDEWKTAADRDAFSKL